MTTFYLLVMIFSTGDARNPFSIQSFDKPFRTEEACDRRAAVFKSDDMMAHACWPVPLPVKETPT